MATYLNKDCLMELYYGFTISDLITVRQYGMSLLNLTLSKWKNYRKLLCECCLVIILPIKINFRVCQHGFHFWLYSLGYSWLRYPSTEPKCSWMYCLLWTISPTIHAEVSTDQTSSKTLKHGINLCVYQGATQWSALPTDAKNTECPNVFKYT